MNEFPRLIQRLTEPDAYPAGLATLVRVEGSSYRRTGARLLLDHAGGRLGSISGGCLEEDLLARLRRLPTAGREPEVVVYDTTAENDLVWGVGLGCHGVVHVVLEALREPPPWLPPVQAALARRAPVELWVDARGTRLPPAAPVAPAGAGVFVDHIHPAPALVVCGAGDDAQPLVRLARTLGWSVQVVDPRPAFATAERFPEADRVECIPVEEVARRGRWDERTAAVIMTHHYRFDLPLLTQLLPLPLPYLGLLGPRRRAERLLAEAGANGDGGAAARLHAPVGLDLGGDGPEAVALAILAEIQATFTARDARPLRERAGPIHPA